MVSKDISFKIYFNIIKSLKIAEIRILGYYVIKWVSYRCIVFFRTQVYKKIFRGVHFLSFMIIVYAWSRSVSFLMFYGFAGTLQDRRDTTVLPPCITEVLRPPLLFMILPTQTHSRGQRHGSKNSKDRFVIILFVWLYFSLRSILVFKRKYCRLFKIKAFL